MPSTATMPQDLRAELMDGPDLALHETLRALADLDRVNAWLCGNLASRRTLLRYLSPSQQKQTLLDIGTGSGRVTASLSRHAARRGVSLRIIGVDRKLCHLLFARQSGNGQLSVVAEAEALPFRTAAIDWSFSNLLFHHFAAEANRRILTEMHRVSTLGTVIVDLRNALLARALIRLLLPLLAVGRVASHDGRLSTDQAWTMEQVRQVISRFPVRELRRRFPFRFSLVIGGRMVPREPPIDNPPLKPTPGS